jgi:putative ubiquitin-RnfH superfamily antitoxin RatB of RatAB toxin-antitoxin module
MGRIVPETAAMINVELAYALPDRQFLISLKVSSGTTALQAIDKSDLRQKFPELDISKVGIFSQVLGSKGLAEADVYKLQEGDRVEIYRPLTLDPKEIRRRRAEEAKKKRQAEL